MAWGASGHFPCCRLRTPGSHATLSEKCEPGILGLPLLEHVQKSPTTIGAPRPWLDEFRCMPPRTARALADADAHLARTFAWVCSVVLHLCIELQVIAGQITSCQILAGGAAGAPCSTTAMPQPRPPLFEAMWIKVVGMATHRAIVEATCGALGGATPAQRVPAREDNRNGANRRHLQANRAPHFPRIGDGSTGKGTELHAHVTVVCDDRCLGAPGTFLPRGHGSLEACDLLPPNICLVFRDHFFGRRHQVLRFARIVLVVLG
mmetsp:Transcript_3871/g.9866  ORF Transcript_3871/g.9866 Transcript_3871/m.9866 type:complete len:263 (-) Transcript_3871:85-873(-)